ncbi:MAG: tetratricopeptide repeat protein [Thermodesulfovibrionales bacterium]|nr:tetratricopeptide repeat protein [Thermodesulfovibrionales bacterium]
MNIDKAIHSAYRYYHSGDLQQAAQICKKILLKRPGNIDVLNMLGAISYQLGNYTAAEKYLKKALELNPHHADACSNLANVLQEQGQLDEAMICIRKAIELNPNNADAYNTMGLVLHKKGEIDTAIHVYHKALQLNPTYTHAYHNLGVAFEGKGLSDEAITSFQKSFQFDPKNADACFHLGMLLKEKKDLNEAISFLQKGLQINPHFAAAYNCLGLIFGEKKQFDTALANFKKAIELNPHYADAYSNIGKVLQEQGQLEEAVIYFRKAIQFDANHAFAYNNLGVVLQIQGRSDEAVAHFQKALQLNPEFGDAHYNLGTVLQEGKNLDEAITCFRKAIQLNPCFLVAYNNLGNSLSKQGKLQEAVDILRQALERNPDFALILNNLGNVLKDQGKVHEAEEFCKRAFEIKSDLFEAYSNFLLFMNYNSQNDAQTIFSEHVRLGKQVGEPFISHTDSYTNERSPTRRLKIGYVSPDFRQHSVAYFIEPAIKEHNNEDSEVFCYSNSLIHDEVTERIRNYTDHWRDITRVPDEIAVRLIREDGIDILVDLTGHTGHNRMLLFARKPAPIQVSWIGYPATTGLSAIDYKIVDTYTDPPGLTDHFYTEELIRMPECFLCYLPPAECPDKIADPPVLSAGHICFGSFNNFSKISAKTVEMWAQILQAVPDASLLLKAKCFADEQTRQHAKKLFSLRNIDIGRIEFLPWEPSSLPHLSLYNRIDIALDTFPYNGTTTTCEALWMGVPVITLAGNTHASRVGVSLLSNVGLPELIAMTPEEYVEKTIQMAHDIAALRRLRAILRDQLEESPLTDAKRFTANLETCYRTIWEKWCSSDLVKSRYDR